MPEITLPVGITLSYIDTGPKDAPPVVLLHGVCMGKQYFRRQFEPLSASHRVIAPDLRGHGESEKAETGHTVPQYARDLKQCLEALEIDKPVLLGWSMGAFVAWDYIQQFGTGEIRGLIVVDEAASDFKTADFPHGFVDFDTLREIMVHVQENPDEFLRELVPAMFHNEQPEADINWMLEVSGSLPASEMSAILFDQCVRDYTPVLESIDIPNVVFWGRHDGLLPIAGGEHVASHTPGARLVAFENSGHCPFFEEAEKFNAEVESFVASV
jgi:non-heme chloroperoxidase